MTNCRLILVRRNHVFSPNLPHHSFAVRRSLCRFPDPRLARRVRSCFRHWLLLACCGFYSQRKSSKKNYRTYAHRILGIQRHRKSASEFSVPLHRRRGRSYLIPQSGRATISTYSEIERKRLTRRCSEPRPVLMSSAHCFMKSLLIRAVADLVSR
jgi:hypothetical protein